MDPQKWEYKLYQVPFEEDRLLEDIFNELGQQGWEYVPTKENYYLFKRPFTPH